MSFSGFRATVSGLPGIDRGPVTIWKTLLTFCIYRICIAAILVMSFGWLHVASLVDVNKPFHVITIAGTYFLLSIGLLGASHKRVATPDIQLTTQVFVDILGMTALMHAFGGVRSGIGLLLLISLAAAALVARGRLAYFHAALAALAILLEQCVQLLYLDGSGSDFLPAGLLSASFFVIAGAFHTFAKYASGAEKIAEERGVDLANLAEINELVIRDMQDGFVVVDESGTIRQYNPQSVAIVAGLNVASGQQIASKAPAIAALWKQWLRDKTMVFPIQVDSQTQRSFQVRFISIGHQWPAPTVIFIEDAGRLRAQAQQMKLVALGRLTASIAHEIRNPLSSINHATELLAEDANRPAEDRRLLDIIHNNAYRLDRMVQEVLDLNRRDRAHPELIVTKSCLEQFVRDFEANEKLVTNSLHYSVSSSRALLFDRGHLDQILWNLTRNAWHHSKQQPGSVRIQAADAADARRIILDVIDDGEGISPRDEPHLFEPFFTTDSKGTGLGLYIARELAEANSANLEYIRLNPEGGTCFRLTLPGG